MSHDEKSHVNVRPYLRLVCDDGTEQPVQPDAHAASAARAGRSHSEFVYEALAVRIRFMFDHGAESSRGQSEVDAAIAQWSADELREFLFHALGTMAYLAYNTAPRSAARDSDPLQDAIDLVERLHPKNITW